MGIIESSGGAEERDRESRQEERTKGDVSCADGLREHRSNFHAVMSLQMQGI